VPLFIGVALTGDDVKNYEIDSSSGDKTLNIPASDTQGIRLRGLLAIPSEGGSTGNSHDRRIDFKDKSTSTVLFTIYIAESAGASGSYGEQAFANIMLPGQGIRFPSGITALIESDYCERMSVFYSGSSSAGDGS
jgi:hypothetical protein